MNDVPLLIFAALVFGQAVAEFYAMLRTRTLRKGHKREWTYYAVALPFKATIGLTLIEHIFLPTHPNVAMVAAGSVLALAGTVIRVRGHFELRGGFSPYVEQVENQRLTQSGMYAKIRHPMYLGSILLLLGMPMILAARFAWLASAVGLIGILVRIHAEEAFLSTRLPGYREYMLNTWRLLPHVY